MKILAAVAVAGGLGAAETASARQTSAAEAGLRLATFKCDATPPLGDTLIWTVKLESVADPLMLKGVVLEAGKQRYVLCALDWCLLCNDSERSFRETLARAAGTEPSCVAVHCVHQHVAPYADEGAHRLLDGASGKPPHLSQTFLDGLRARMGEAVAEAVKRLEPFDRIGCGTAVVERVASQRRLKAADGKIVSRVSETGKTPELAALPEGDVDPVLRTVTFARGEKVLARLHYYATHPQTHSCDGSVSADFVGAAREAREREEKVFQIYFTGCAGNVTVGKYNDSSLSAREALTQHLLSGLRAAAAASRFSPADRFVWRTEELVLPVRTDDDFVQQCRKNLDNPRAASGARVFKGAMRLASVARAKRPFRLTSLRIGDARIVLLPGEPMLEFQKFAQGRCPDRFVAVAGYGDCGTSYICTDRMFTEGGYEPTATNLAPGAEPVLKDAIQRLLER